MRDLDFTSASLPCSDRSSPLFDWEVDMRFLGAALVCIAVLYGMDAYFSNGRYFASLQREVADIYQHW
jgi:hypothetical protein